MAVKKLIDLDNPGVYRKLDTEGMLNHIHNFPQMCQQAWEMALSFELPESYRTIDKIVILGMGGSAIGGDLVNSLVINESKIPIFTCRDYNLPHYADKNTLVIASSYSGNTEETLSSFAQAANTKAKKLAITTGGKLKTLCEEQKIPVFSYEYKSQPRAALPYSFFPLLGILQNLGIIKSQSSAAKKAFKSIQTLADIINEEIPAAQNPAKQLAQKLYGKFTVIYGSGITAEVAHRWKTQINENAETTVFYEIFSELNHNAIVGYHFPEEYIKNMFVILLDSNLLHDRIKLRYALTQKLLTKAAIPYQIISGAGDSALSQMLNLILFGDFVSYYLAMLNQVDPTPVKNIDFLKDHLTKK